MFTSVRGTVTQVPMRYLIDLLSSPYAHSEFRSQSNLLGSQIWVVIKWPKSTRHVWYSLNLLYLNFILFQTQSIDREVHIWAILEHEYILPFHGTVEGFGQFRAMVSPWMPNGNLNSYINRTGVTLATLNTRLCIVSSNYETHCKSLLYSQ